MAEVNEANVVEKFHVNLEHQTFQKATGLDVDKVNETTQAMKDMGFSDSQIRQAQAEYVLRKMLG